MWNSGFRRYLFGIVALAVATFALAEDVLQVRDARALATVPGQGVAAAYMTIKSRTAARIVAAESDAAGAVQFHMMSLRDDIMRMRQLDSLDLPAGQDVRLAPGGVHLMLAGLKHPLRAGGSLDLRLTVIGADGTRHVVQLNLPVVDARLERADRHD